MTPLLYITNKEGELLMKKKSKEQMETKVVPFSCVPDRSCCYQNSRCLMMYFYENGKPKTQCGCYSP